MTVQSAKEVRSVTENAHNGRLAVIWLAHAYLAWNRRVPCSPLDPPVPHPQWLRHHEPNPFRAHPLAAMLDVWLCSGRR